MAKTTFSEHASETFKATKYFVESKKHSHLNHHLLKITAEYNKEHIVIK